MTIDEIEDGLDQANRRLRKLSFFVYAVAHSSLAFCVRKRLMAISDDINGVSDQLDALDAQAPTAITAALAAAGGDPNAPAAVTRLKASAAKLITDLQAVVSGA